MNDTNIQSEGECPDCRRHETDGQLLCDRIAKLEKEKQELRDYIDKGTNAAIDRSITFERLVISLEKLEAENKELKECLHDAIHAWSIGNVFKRCELLRDRARKLLEP